MTYHDGQPAAFPYPDKPWYDGQTAYKDNEDGSRTVATYEQLNNVWHIEVIADAGLGDYYITTRDVYLTNPVGSSQLNEAYALVDGDTTPPPRFQTQEDLNQLQGDIEIRSIKQTYRVNDNVDFINNTVSGGFWVHTLADQPAALPGPTEFFLFNEFDQNTTEFSEVRKVIFAGEGTGGLNANPNLQYTRAGDNLLIQENNDNHFGYYVVDEIEVIGEPSLGGLWFIQMLVRVARNRTFGDSQEFSHCTVKVARPVFTLSATTPPVLSENGQLWYNPSTNTLSVWDQDSEKFYPIGGASGDDSVVVGPTPPLDPYLGQMWFDTGRLELYIWYVEDQDGTEVGSWIPASPLGARVSAGEALQQQILTRVNGHDNALDDLYANQADFLRNQTSNDVTTSFRIRSGGNTLVSASGNKLGLYNLSEPTNASHAATAGYVDNHIGPTWKWIVDGSNLASQSQAIRWYTSDNITMNFYVHGSTLTGNNYHFYSGPKSDGNDPRELMSIYGLNPEGKMKHILIAPVRNWEFGGGFCAFRCNVADMRIWDPTGLENETPVYFRFGALF